MQQLSRAIAAAPDTEKTPERETKTQQECASDTKRDDDALQGGRPGAVDMPKADSRTPARGYWEVLGLLLLTLAAAAPWVRAGLWDPAEVHIADLARRAGLQLFGGHGLAVAGASDAIPSVEEVGRGEFPVLAIALSLRAFGSEVWAVRLPLAVFGFTGLAALYVVCRRLASVQTALVAALVLATCPAFFVQVRTGLGDVATMACVALAFAGFHLAWADGTLKPRARALAFAVALAAALGAYFSRGAWIGVSVPALASGFTWLLLGGPRLTSSWGLGRAQRYAALGTLLVGAIGLGLGIWGWLSSGGTDYNYALGSALSAPKKLPTHDTTLGDLGHALFPWSAIIPSTLAAALTANGTTPKARGRTSLSLGLFLVGALMMLAHGALAPKLGLMPFAAPFALAGLCALGLDQVNRQRSSALLLAASGVALLVLLLEDFSNEPAKALVAYGMDTTPYATVTVPHTRRFFQVASGLGIGALAVLALEQVEWIGRYVQRLLAVKGVTRARLVVLPMLAGACVLSWGYYPALARQLSPAGVYDTYHRSVKGTEPLGVVGKGATQGTAFYANGPVQALESPKLAVDWLTNGGEERRWLILKRKDLAAANSSFRAKLHAGNLPVIDADSSEILLASNRLTPNQANSNPLSLFVFDTAPPVQHPVAARFGTELELLGWDLVNDKGVVVERLARGKAHDFRIYYSVLHRPGTSWKTFIHIDGSGTFADKRVNGDHDTTPDYPMREWQPGDVVVDSFHLQVDSGFPAGNYGVYFGLFNGNQRFTVASGPQKDNRVIAGTLTFE